MSILNNTAIKNLVGVLKEGFPFENNKKSDIEKKYLYRYFLFEALILILLCLLYGYNNLELNFKFLNVLIFISIILMYGISLLKVLNIYSYVFYSRNKNLSDLEKNKSVKGITYSLTLHSASLYSLVWYSAILYFFLNSLISIDIINNWIYYLTLSISYFLILISLTKNSKIVKWETLILLIIPVIYLKLWYIHILTILFILVNLCLIRICVKQLNMYSIKTNFLLSVALLNFLL